MALSNAFGTLPHHCVSKYLNTKNNIVRINDSPCTHLQVHFGQSYSMNAGRNHCWRYRMLCILSSSSATGGAVVEALKGGYIFS